MDHSGATPNPNISFLSYCKKSSVWPLIDLSCHWITSPFCLKRFPYPIHYLSQNIKCVRPCHWKLLLFQYFAIIGHIWPWVTFAAKKTPGAHLRHMGYQCTPIWQLYHVQALRRCVHKLAVTHTQTHTQTHTDTYTHTYTCTPAGPHRFLMLLASEPKTENWVMIWERVISSVKIKENIATYTAKSENITWKLLERS